jgi:membrane protease YdiL (CAAX protease family)
VVLGLAVWVTHRKALAGLLVPRGRDLLLGLAAGVVMTAATYLLYPPFVGMMPDLAAGTRELYHLFNSGPAPIRMTLLPLVILAEEVVWRGLVQSAAEPRVGRIPAAVLTAGLYSLAHLPVGSPLLAGIAWCCGLYWGLLRAGTGSLWVPLLAHALWDALVMAAFPLRA